MNGQFARRLVQACFIGMAFVLGVLLLWQASALLLLEARPGIRAAA